MHAYVILASSESIPNT